MGIPWYPYPGPRQGVRRILAIGGTGSYGAGTHPPSEGGCLGEQSSQTSASHSVLPVDIVGSMIFALPPIVGADLAKLVWRRTGSPDTNGNVPRLDHHFVFGAVHADGTACHEHVRIANHSGKPGDGR